MQLNAFCKFFADCSIQSSRAMKSLKIAASLFVLSATSSLAADLSSLKSAPVASSLPIWSGFYAGVSLGGSWANSSDISFVSTPVYSRPGNLPGYTASIDQYALTNAIVATRSIDVGYSPSLIGGGQIGYNWMIDDKSIVGIETDFQGLTGGNATNSNVASASVPNNNHNAYGVSTINASRALNYLGTFRGRLGYLVTQNIQLYGTAGFSYGGVELNGFVAQGVVAGSVIHPTTNLYYGALPFNGVSVGWTAGGGLEWMFTQNLSLKAEYLYYDLGSTQTASGVTVRSHITSGGLDYIWLNQTKAQTKFDGNIVRAGLNYHLNFASAPIVAKF
jgi:outer membrane immunogenic protein